MDGVLIKLEKSMSLLNLASRKKRPLPEEKKKLIGPAEPAVWFTKLSDIKKPRDKYTKKHRNRPIS
jgi:hypothetical protein